jgi:hypothetical protein
MSPNTETLSTAPKGLKMKNTFLHVEDSFDVESAWIRRQTSEPAPALKQVSAAMAMPKLERITSDDEADREDNNAAQEKSDSSDFDDFDDLDEARLNRQVSSCKRQISALPDTAADMERQMSTMSAVQAFDRQISSLSAAGFCRQVTEQQWPSYSTQGVASMKTAVNGIAEVEESKEVMIEDSTGSTPSQPMLEPPIFDPQGLGSMFWPTMDFNSLLSPTPQAMDFSSLLSPPPQKNYNRRKARSLVTQAQEAQRAQQLAMLQMQMQQKQMMIMNMANSAHLQSPEQLKVLEKEIQDQWKLMVGLSAHAQQQNIPAPAERREVPAERRERFEQKHHLEQQLKEALGVQAEVQLTNAGMSFDGNFDASTTVDDNIQAPTLVDSPTVVPQSNLRATMEAKFCPDCGGRVEKSYKFCKFCGSSTACLRGMSSE